MARSMLLGLALAGSAAGLWAQPVDLTARDQAHEAHHSWAKRRTYALPDGKKGAGPPVLSAFPAGQQVTLQDYACKAAAVAVVHLGQARPVVTSDGLLIFTDYSLTVQHQLRGPAPSVVTRVGGEVPSGSPRSFRTQVLPLLVPGETYLLFLSSVPGSDALAADFPGGTLRLLPGGLAEQVDGVGLVKGLPKSGQAVVLADLIAAIQAVEGCGQ